MMSVEPDISVNLAGLKLKNPLIAASGCYGYGRDYSALVPPESWGAITVKGTTLQKRDGNPPPRLIETASGLINSVGLQNPGIETVIREEVPLMAGVDVPFIINISGESVDEYVLLAQKVNHIGEFKALELNISCPNVKKGGLTFGSDPPVVTELVRKVRAVYHKTLIVKLSPNTGDIAAIAVAAAEGGADVLSLINTVKAMEIDIESERPVLNMVAGGLSGPAIRPVALRAVWEVAGAVDIPVIGMGGIVTAEDAVQFILAGASAVAIGTANFVEPLVVITIREGIKDFMNRKGYKSIADFRGAARRGL